MKPILFDRKFNAENESVLGFALSNLEIGKSGKIRTTAYCSLCEKFPWIGKIMKPILFDRKFNAENESVLGFALSDLEIGKSGKIRTTAYCSLCEKFPWIGKIMKPILFDRKFNAENESVLGFALSDLEIGKSGKIRTTAYCSICEKFPWIGKIMKSILFDRKLNAENESVLGFALSDLEIGKSGKI